MQKRIASQCNDAAWALIEKPDLAAGECFALVRLAGTASYHWSAIGTAGNIALADLLFSWALARVGAAAPAVDAASCALRYFTEHQSEDGEELSRMLRWRHRFTVPAMGRASPALTISRNSLRASWRRVI